MADQMSEVKVPGPSTTFWVMSQKEGKIVHVTLTLEEAEQQLLVQVETAAFKALGITVEQFKGAVSAAKENFIIKKAKTSFE